MTSAKAAAPQSKEAASAGWSGAAHVSKLVDPALHLLAEADLHFVGGGVRHGAACNQPRRLEQTNPRIEEDTKAVQSKTVHALGQLPWEVATVTDSISLAFF